MQIFLIFFFFTFFFIYIFILKSAWVTKTCENEFVEVELLNGKGGFYLDRIELINLNARAYKISVSLLNENLNTSMISKEKICKKKSSLPFDWVFYFSNTLLFFFLFK